MAASCTTLATSHLLVAVGPFLGGLPFGVVGGEDVAGRAGRRGRVVDRAQLRHPFAVALFALAQSGTQLVTGFRCCFRGRAAQRVGAHHDALAVDLQHQQVVRRARWRLTLGVEGLEVDRCHRGELLHLPFADVLAAGPCDGLHGLVEAAAGTFHRGQFAQSVRLLLWRQVEPGISRIQVRTAALAVGDPTHCDLAEHGRQRAGVTGLNGTVRYPLGVHDPAQPGLIAGPQFQVVSEQLAEHVPGLHLEPFLQLGRRQPRRVTVLQPADQRLEDVVTGRERISGRPGRRSAHRRPPPPNRATSVWSPACPSASNRCRRAR